MKYSPYAESATEFRDMAVWMDKAIDLCTEAIDIIGRKGTTKNRPRRAGDCLFNKLGMSGMFALCSNIPEKVREEKDYHPIHGSGGNSDAWNLSTDFIDKTLPKVLIWNIRVDTTVVRRLLRRVVLPPNRWATIEAHRATVDDKLGRLNSAVLNETIKVLSRPLVQANSVTERRFEQEPAIRRLHSGLDPATNLTEMNPETDECRFTQWHLKSARNRGISDLGSANRIVTESLSP